LLGPENDRRRRTTLQIARRRDLVENAQKNPHQRGDFSFSDRFPEVTCHIMTLSLRCDMLPAESQRFAARKGANPGVWRESKFSDGLQPGLVATGPDAKLFGQS
jgi:hypothetical protein